MSIRSLGGVARIRPALLWVCILASLAPAVSAEPTQRNILFISIDDLRNWVGYNAGYPGSYPGTVHTPNIDALAAVSTRYRNAYTTVPQCVGSRTSVMMGMSPATHGLTHSLWGVEPVYKALYNNPTITSLPQVLSQHGYYTASTGKLFNNPLPARWTEQGPAPAAPELNGFVEVLADTEEHPDQIVADWAVDFMSTYSGADPFFLAVGFYQPHIPWRTYQWAYDLYPLEDVIAPTPIPDDLADEPEAAVALVDQQLYELIEAAGMSAAFTQAYLAAISHMDAMVGQLLAALAASPYANNTDIVLWSDHGFHLGEKFHWQKNTFWEESVKVPLLVSSPGNTDYPVGDVTAAVSLLDLAPTVLDLAGLPVHPQFEGVPLREAGNHGPVYVYFNEGRATVTQAGVKTIDYDLTVSNPANVARYDLVADFIEQFNLGPPPGC